MSTIVPPTIDLQDEKRGVGRQFQVWPLDRFSQEKQDEIAYLVAQPKPPAKWLRGELFQMPSRAWYEWHWQRGVDPDSRRPPIDPSLRQRVYDRDGHACLHCGSTEGLSLDHIIPFSKGGPDTFDNFQTLCRPCNSRKGAKV